MADMLRVRLMDCAENRATAQEQVDYTAERLMETMLAAESAGWSHRRIAEVLTENGWKMSREGVKMALIRHKRKAEA